MSQVRHTPGGVPHTTEPEVSYAGRAELGFLPWVFLILVLVCCGLLGCGGSSSSSNDPFAQNSSGFDRTQETLAGFEGPRTPVSPGSGDPVDFFPPPGNTGSLSFFFTQGQATPSEVPSGTGGLLFEFFEAQNRTGQKTFEDTLATFEPNISFCCIPISTRSVQVTALGAQGIPLMLFGAEVNVIADENVDVNLGIGTPIFPVGMTVSPLSSNIEVSSTQAFTAFISFSNGFVIDGVTSLTGLAWSSDNIEVATVDSATGVATGLEPGQANITATLGNLSSSGELIVD